MFYKSVVIYKQFLQNLNLLQIFKGVENERQIFFEI